ncbi:TPA: phage terminase large subunit family protein, partial [Escherichia coli]
MNLRLRKGKSKKILLKEALFPLQRYLASPQPMSLSQWANTFAVLSRETSAQTGKFRSYPYQDGMMDAITDPSVTYVSVMKSARVGYTKILDHVVGYYLAHDPSPILVVQPRVEDAEDYSKTEIAPMLRDTPVLAAISGDPKAKNSNQTILRKTFSNGANLTLVGAN